jgi:hypothetical protein
MKTGRPIKTSGFSVEPSQFFSPTTPEVAYILGLLWADGYVLKKENPAVNRVSLGVQREDFDEFLPILERVGEWRVSYRKNKGKKEQGEADISNRPLVDFLTKNDYTSKSNSSACKILSLIPNNLKHYWFRGLFDGDGCIYHHSDGMHIKTTICSSYDQNWKYIQDLFTDILQEDRFFIKLYKRKNGNGHSKIEISKRSAMIKFLDYIYNGYGTDNIGLKRKYEKYLRVLQREEHCKHFYRNKK